MREPNRIENRNIHATTLILPELDFNPEGEILLFDKPYRCTSFDVVAKVKSAIRKKFNKKIKVGHAGTLDPLATGLVILCTGKMTKQINMLMDLEKEYTGTFFLGATTSSFDMEKEVNATFRLNILRNSKSMLLQILSWENLIKFRPSIPQFALMENALTIWRAEVRKRRSNREKFRLTDLKSPALHSPKSILGLFVPKAPISVPSPAISVNV